MRHENTSGVTDSTRKADKKIRLEMHWYGKLHARAFLVTIIHADITAKPTCKTLGDTQVELGIDRCFVWCIKPIEKMIPTILRNASTRILNIECKQMTAIVTAAAYPHFTLFCEDAGSSH